MQRHYNHDSGHTSELYAAYKLSEKGYSVLWPLKTQSKYDIAIEKDGRILKIQIKKATWSKTGPYMYLQSRTSKDVKSKGFQYTEDEVDYFLFTDNNKIWLVPFKEIEGMTSICLGSTNPNYNPYTKYDATKWLI